MEELDLTRAGAWRNEQWRRMWYGDVEKRDKAAGRKIRKQSRLDREWTQRNRDHLLSKIREWDKNFEKECRELAMSVSDLGEVGAASPVALAMSGSLHKAVGARAHRNSCSPRHRMRCKSKNDRSKAFQ